MGPREILSVAKATKGIYYWMKEQGVEWEINSDRNPQIRRNSKSRDMIAAGCLVQWYEIDMFEEYVNSLIEINW